MSLVSTFMPYKFVIIPLFGVLVGTTKFACFPLLQYSMFYLFGIYFIKSGMKLSRGILILSVFFTGASLIFMYVAHRIPNRFPPECFWITLPCAPLVAYWLVLGKIKKIGVVSKVQRQIGFYGSNMLDYLVLSNVLIFLTHHCFGQTFRFLQCVFMIVAIYLCCIVYTHIKLYLWHNQ